MFLLPCQRKLPLENADRRTNVARMAVLKCIIQFSMQTPPGIDAEQNRFASVLNNGSIMPVLRVKFKAKNGRVQEGNVVVDSSTGATVM